MVLASFRHFSALVFYRQKHSGNYGYQSNSTVKYRKPSLSERSKISNAEEERASSRDFFGTGVLP